MADRQHATHQDGKITPASKGHEAAGGLPPPPSRTESASAAAADSHPLAPQPTPLFSYKNSYIAQLRVPFPLTYFARPSLVAAFRARHYRYRCAGPLSPFLSLPGSSASAATTPAAIIGAVSAGIRLSSSREFSPASPLAAATTPAPLSAPPLPPPLSCPGLKPRRRER